MHAPACNLHAHDPIQHAEDATIPSPFGFVAPLMLENLSVGKLFWEMRECSLLVGLI